MGSRPGGADIKEAWPSGLGSALTRLLTGERSGAPSAYPVLFTAQGGSLKPDTSPLPPGASSSVPGVVLIAERFRAPML